MDTRLIRKEHRRLRPSLVARSGVRTTLAACTIVAGLMVRRVSLGLPWTFVKYAGSSLWATMLYWMIAAARPAWRPRNIGVFAGMVAALVECFKLVHTPGLDAFRRTIAGALLLGRFFSVRDLLAYGLAIVAVALLDDQMVQRRQV